jgi:hypothetical protein
MVMQTAPAVLVLVATLLTLKAEAPDFRLFGSVGNEGHVTPGSTSSRLNPGNFLMVPPVSNSIDLTLLGDLVPENKQWKFHFKLRGSNDWNRDRSVSRVDVGELSYSYSAASWLDIQGGRSIERWGTGYAWNPTGVVNPRKNPSDPNDRRGLYGGVDNLKADLFISDWNLTVLGVAEIDWNGGGGKRLAGSGWAARVYRLINGLDFSITASGGNGLPNSQGISLSRVFGTALEIHGEAALLSDTLRFRPGEDSWQVERRRHLDLLLGGQYTFPHNVNLVLEYFHSGNGLDSREWGNFSGLVDLGGLHLQQGNPVPLLTDNVHFSVLSMARDYGFGRLYWLFHHDKLEAELLVLTNLRDGSALIRPGIYWKIRPDWSLYWLQGELMGGPGTEFGHLQVSRVSDFGVRYYF